MTTLWILLLTSARAASDGDFAMALAARVTDINQKSGRTVGTFDAAQMIEKAARGRGVTLDGSELPPDLLAWRLLVVDAWRLHLDACEEAEAALKAARPAYDEALRRLDIAYRRGDLETAGLLRAEIGGVALTRTTVRDACAKHLDKTANDIMTR